MKDIETLVREHLTREADAVRFDPDRWTDRVATRRRRSRGVPSLRALGTAAAALVLLAGVAVPLVLVWGLGGDPTVVPGDGPEYVRHVDLDDGLAITIPSAWTFREDPTQPIEPKNVFGVGSWDFPRGGVCAPFDALDALPSDGAFLWLIEYHGTDHPEDFVARPERFDLSEFRYGETSCYAPMPQYQLRFQEAGRFFQWQVALGPEASDSIQHEVVRTLDSLEVGGICDASDDAYVPSVVPTSGTVGSTAAVTGEPPHGEPGPGGYPVPPTTWIEAWWNLKPRDAGSALPGGMEPVASEPGPVLSLGRVDVSTTCTYDLAFAIPETAPGTYPIVVLYGSDEGAAAFEPVRFEVTG